MYKISPACFWQVLILFYICPSISPAEDIDNLVQTGKAIINSYANRLQDEYGSTFHQGKYARVGDVCKKNTPTLTINGWQIKRISLSTINQINDTDAVDTRILEDFKLKYDAGWSLERLAYYKLDETENYKQFRYYKLTGNIQISTKCTTLLVKKNPTLIQCFNLTLSTVSGCM